MNFVELFNYFHFQFMTPQYSTLFSLAQEAFSCMSARERQKFVNRQWSVVKNDPVRFENLKKRWKDKINKSLKRKDSVWSQFQGLNVNKKRRVEKNEVKEDQKLVREEKVKEEKIPETPSPARTKRRSPRQEQLMAEISLLVSEIAALKTLLAVPEPLVEHRVKLTKTVQKKDKCVLELKRLQSMVKASRKQRRQNAVILNSAGKRPRQFPGRPPLEDSDKFSDLPNLIIKIAQKYAAADPKRRSELVTLPKSLDDLVEALKKEGMEVKRSALYMRLIPRRRNSSNGKRHVRVVPVQLRKPQYDGRKKHISARFCFATSLMLRELSS